MGLLRKMVNFLKTNTIFVIIILIFVSFCVHIGLATFFDTGITLAVPTYKLANTKWLCEVKEDELYLEFNDNGTILASRERGYELVKKGTKWKRFDHATISGENRIVAGYVYKFNIAEDMLTITKYTEFSGTVVDEWVCTPVGKAR